LIFSFFIHTAWSTDQIKLQGQKANAEVIDYYGKKEIVLGIKSNQRYQPILEFQGLHNETRRLFTDMGWL
jgi:hypothetical protein